MISLILLVFAFVCLALAAFDVAAPRVNLGWAGMAFWCLSILIGGLAGHIH